MSPEPDAAILLFQALIARLEARSVLDGADRSAIVDDAVARACTAGPAGWPVADRIKQIFGRAEPRAVAGARPLRKIK